MSIVSRFLHGSSNNGRTKRRAAPEFATREAKRQFAEEIFGASYRNKQISRFCTFAADCCLCFKGLKNVTTPSHFARNFGFLLSLSFFFKFC